MKVVHGLAIFAAFAGALCPPITGVCQAAVSAAQVQSPPVSSVSPAVDATKRLDGRLFFSSSERQRLDQARKRGLAVNDEGDFVEAPPNVLNGFVKRSDGMAVVWVDGDVRWNAESQSTQSLVPSNVGGPAVYLQSTGGETQAASPKPKVQAKKVVKPRVRKTTAPRLLPL